MISLINAVSGAIEIQSKPTSSLPQNSYMHEDGLAHCKNCHGLRQVDVCWPPNFTVKKRVSCACECMEQKCGRRTNEGIAAKARRKSESMTPAGVSVPGWHDLHLPSFDPCQQPWNKILPYAANITRMKNERKGLLLFGPAGSGKTTAAIYLAKSAEAAGLTVIYTTPVRVINDILERTAKGRNQLIDSICHFDVVILDDLGVEGKTSLSREHLFNLVDSIYRARKLLIVATDLGLANIKSEVDPATARLYARIQEICQPIAFPNINYRQSAMAQARLETLSLFDELNDIQAQAAARG